MIEKVLGIEKMSILQCQELAKKIGFNSATFDLVGPKGKTKAKWVDAYLGLFMLTNKDVLMMVKDIMFVPDLYCENVMLGEERK